MMQPFMSRIDRIPVDVEENEAPNRDLDLFGYHYWAHSDMSHLRRYAMAPWQPATGERSNADRADLLVRTPFYGAKRAIINVHSRNDSLRHNTLSRLIGTALVGESYNFAVPKNKSLQRAILAKLLQSLDGVHSSDLLTSWLFLIAKDGVSPEEGILPDAPALNIFTRLLELDRTISLTCFDILLNPKNTPRLQSGYFQLSLLACLTAFVSDQANGPKSLPTSWIEHEMTQVMQGEPAVFGDAEMKLSLLASFTALLILSLEDGPQEAVKMGQSLDTCLHHLKTPEDRQLFLQFLADSLGEFISPKTVKLHWIKLLHLAQFIEEEGVLWPTTDFILILSQLRAVFTNKRIKRRRKLEPITT